MEKLRHFLFRSWYVLETLEDRIYHIILDVAVFVSVISVITGVAVRSPMRSILSSLLILLFLIVLQFITMRHPKYSNQCRIILTLGLNLVLFPLNYFASGGIYGGVILFFLLGLALCAVLTRGNLSGAVFLLSVLVMELSVIISSSFPHLVQEMTQKQQSRSVMITLLLAGMALYSIVLLILRSYSQERIQNEILMQKLRDLSVTDVLSGLYNRRELFRRLEVMYGGPTKNRIETLSLEHRYIAMFDVDNFKKINDTYGHSFGDSALVSVSEALGRLARAENGELSARYGGEEFVTILTAESLDDAYSRVDAVRQQIASMQWEEHPQVHVTVSGGLIACEDHPDLTQALHDVDELLYQAKAAGKNRICRPDASSL